ncbi:IS66 family insertion sequence element accessory protein TnpB [Ramlibacter monticola]|uniref:IS66 family insertion sequence element accessory protein TnpB n=1 Tax=Ramlibacter monticola TaxID=1926872 RepID=A0A936Z5U9_9BURK|nr:IS66 family insertion sequence element accessory protein TnpB [Ramlibacter monticola]
MDLRCGPERLLAHVVQVFGAARAHHGYLFANPRHTRVKLLVHDGFGLWCAVRRLNQGRFCWPDGDYWKTTDSDARPGRGQDQARLRVGLRSRRIRPDAGRGDLLPSCRYQPIVCEVRQPGE